MDNSIVTILTVEKQEVASFIKEKFEFEGVQCFYSHEVFEHKNGSASNIIKLKVRVDDTEKAVKVLLEINNKYDLQKIKQDDTLKDLKKIIVPVDLSDYALNAGKYAVAIAKTINAEIKFLYIYRDPSDTGSVKSTTSWEKHAKLVAKQTLHEAQEKLIKFTDQLKEQIPKEDFLNVKLHYSIHKGEPEHVIKVVSERYNPYIMILGTKGKKDKKNVFIGSVTTTIIENLKFPVLTVPESVTLPGDQLNIMYATNFNDSDHTSLNTLLKIIGPFETKIHCIHIEAESDPFNKEKMNDLNEMLKKNYSDAKIQCDLFENKDLLVGFENFIKEKNIDIISFSSPKRNIIYKIFNSNKLKRMVSASKIPMLIFRV